MACWSGSRSNSSDWRILSEELRWGEGGVWRRGQCYRTYFMIATRAVSCALLLVVAVGEHLVSEAYSRSPANRQPGALSRSALVIAGV